MSRKAEFAPIRMVEYKVFRLQCNVNDAVNPSAAGDYSIRFHADCPRELELPIIQVTLGMQIQKADDGCLFDEVEILGSGAFAVPPDMTDEDVHGYAIPSAMHLLFGVLRGVVATVTASYPGGSFYLPAITGACLHPNVKPTIKRPSDKKPARRKKQVR